MESPKYARKCIYACIKWLISVFNQEPCGFEIKTKEICLWTIPIAFENILEGTYLHTGFEK